MTQKVSVNRSGVSAIMIGGNPEPLNGYTQFNRDIALLPTNLKETKMERKQRSIRMFAAIMGFVAMGLFMSPAMLRAGDLEPSGVPGPTMKTLNQIPPTWSQILPAAQRFELVMNDEAVLDKETGLVWARATPAPQMDWMSAMLHCQNLNIGGRKGWRLPTVEELASLVDVTRSNPTLPVGHPFLNVPSSYYWSSTTCADNSVYAWYVGFYNGYVGYLVKSSNLYVRAVRGGQ